MIALLARIAIWFVMKMPCGITERHGKIFCMLFNMQVFTFCESGLKMPILATFGGFWSSDQWLK